MSLKLLKVELFNIRSHEHLIFEPASVGITAIQGANGTGKSSIVDSIAWALFGTKPDGVSKSVEIFRNGLGEKDKALARVDLLIDGVQYRIERRRVNKHGTLECEIWSITDKDGEEESEQLAGPAISHAEPYIRKLLRMDEKGFLSSILVQQKQVDHLISSGPRERGEVIEKLTGIASLTEALKQSRAEHKLLKKATESSAIDEAGLAKVRKEEQSTVDAISTLAELTASLKVQAKELKTEGVELKGKLEEATEKFEHKADVERRIAELKTRVAVKQEALEETLQAKDQERRALSDSTAGSYDELAQQAADLDKRRDRLRISRSRADDSVKQLKREVEDLQAENEAAGEAPEESFETLTETTAKLVERQEALSSEGREAKAQQASVLNAIKVIEHGESCPTCLQKVADSSVAVKALEVTSAALQNTQDTNRKLLEEGRAELAELQRKLAVLETHERVTVRLAEIEGELAQKKKELDNVSSELLVLEKELKGVNKLFDEAKQNKERQRSYKRLLEKAQGLTEEIENFEFELQKLEKEDAGLESASQRSLNALQKKLDAIRSKHSSASIEYAQATGDLNLNHERLAHLRQDIQRHEEEISRHKELLQSVAVAAHSVEIVAEFREERIRNSIPTIEVYASDLLSRFTDGMFTRLTLDQKFNATVYLADGTRRSVGLLSGGELSAAAISLRLAIAMLLNSGSEQNTVILDEVLVSQDGLRAELILSTVKEMFQGQVVLIAHNDLVESIADKIVSLPMS